MTQQLELAKPFYGGYVRKDPDSGADYVSHHIVNQRLIQVLGSSPRFQLLEVLRGDVPELPVTRSGKERPRLTGVVVGVLARMEADIDGESTFVDECGEVENPHNELTDGARLKKALSDAYKRCAMRLGCGLHLWAQDHYFLYEVLSRDESQEVEAGSTPTPNRDQGTKDGASAPPVSPPTTTTPDQAPTTTMPKVVTEEALLERFGWEKVKPVAREVAMDRREGTVPVRMAQLADCSPETLAEIAQRLGWHQESLEGAEK